MTRLPPVEKLPLAVRKNLRDDWDNKKADIEKELSDVLTVPWTVEVNPNQIYAYAGDGYAKESPGSCIAGYINGAIYQLKSYESSFGKEGLKELNSIAHKHVITMDVDDAKRFNYGGVDVHEGNLRILFAPDNLGVNIDYACEKETLQKALNEAAPAEGSSEPLSFATRTGIRQDYDPKIEEIRENIANLIAKPDIKLNPNFEETFAKLKEESRVEKTELREDWEKYIGYMAFQYFEGLVSQMQWQKFENDDLLQEGFNEAVDKGEITLRIVDRLKEGLYGECEVEDGVLYLQQLGATAMPSPDYRRHLHQAVKPFERPASYVSRALTAAGYPLRGIYYFLRHPAYYPLFLSRLLPLSLISILVYTILFTFAFLPQYAFLAIFHGWGAWVNAVVLVLGEGLVIIQGLFEGFFVDECRVDVFDATLIDQGLVDLLRPHRIIFPDAPTSVKMLGKPSTTAVFQPWSLVQIIELIVCLPLNLIPYVGTPAFIIITGARLGTFAHYRWFELHGLSKKERKREISRRRWEYIWFGTVAMLLELVPILSFFFLLTSTTGSALWAAKLEHQARQPPATEPVGDNAGEAVDDDQPDAPPPPYSDDPV
ncbi:putative Glycosyltransferase 2-like domain-containing protein [Seiridium unicorne]|uniref:Glycosyltransferase 2-like domain-containing protein n=1 Tax=Seiridium unicorne TaxID=138068 RepID=A0ABR2VEJ3_9PEZI